RVLRQAQGGGHAGEEAQRPRLRRLRDEPDGRWQEGLSRPGRQLQHRRRSAARQRPADTAGEPEALDYALAALSGALFAVSFPRFGHPALGWAALVPLLIVLGRPAPSERRPVLLGLS